MKLLKDPLLKRYINLDKPGKVLDLGCGKGRRLIGLSSFGFHGIGIDNSKEQIQYCEKMKIQESLFDLEFLCMDVRSFKIAPKSYSLILCNNVLQFLSKEQAIQIIDNIKNGLQENGMVYFSVFNKQDPSYKIEKDNPGHSYYEISEVLNFWKDFQLQYISESYFLDNFHDTPHYHGIIDYIGIKN